MRSLVSKFPINLLIYLVFSTGLALVFAHVVAIGHSELALLVLVSLASISLSLYV